MRYVSSDSVQRTKLTYQVAPENVRFPITVRADHPVPPVRAFYFDVTIVEEGDDYRFVDVHFVCGATDRIQA